jgi:PAS domain S-box-containing protein
MDPKGHKELRARLKQRSLTISRWLCLSAAVFPLLAAAGWIFDLPILRSLHPALPAMQPNTAFGLVLLAIAILFTGDHQPAGRGSIAPLIAGSVVSLLGWLTLSEYVFAVDLGIDRLFIDGAAVLGRYPGRPSPQTSANLALLGVAVIIHEVRRLPIRVGQACTLVVAANAVVAMTGYLFDTEQFYGFPFFEPAIGMAIHTAAGFVLLAGGLLGTRPDAGMMSLIVSDTRSSRMARQILLTSILTPPIVGAVTRAGVLAGWYDVGVQAALFVVVIVGVVVRTTWKTTRQAEADEYRARSAFQATEAANARLKQALDDRRIFEALIENSSDFIGIADPNGTPMYINAAGRRMVGLEVDFPIANTRIPDYFFPEDRALQSDVVEKSTIEPGHWSRETRLRHWQTGQPIPVSHEHFTIQEPETGRVLGMGTITRDISDIKRAEEQLRQSQERFELALRGGDLAAWDWNIKTGEVVFSPRWAEMRGLRPEDVRPHVDSWTSAIHPEDWPRVQRTLTEYLEGRLPEYRVEFRVRMASGDWIWIRDRGKVFERDEAGQPLRMVGTELDITERKHLEDEQRFLAEVGTAMASIVDFEKTLTNIARLTVRTLADYFIVDILDPSGQVRRFEVLSRDPSQTLLCDVLRKASGSALTTSVVDSRRPVLVERLSPETTASLIDAAGDPRVLQAAGLKSVIAVPLLAYTTVVGVMTLVSSSSSPPYHPSDVRLAEELGLRVALAITNARLYTDAQRAIEARDKVLAIVSHDLRSPLVAIDWLVRLLVRSGPVDHDRLAEFVDHVRPSIAEMHLLIDDLLDVARIHGGTLAVEMSRARVIDLVRPVLDGIRVQCDGKRQMLEVDVFADLPDVVVDTRRIRQAMSNLLGNAVKFTPEGGTIRVSATDRGDSVAISVVDTGRGISPEHLPRVFDWLWQAPASGRSGAGLGLAIVKGIVDAHRGTISVASEPGKGSVFTFTLPAMTAPSHGAASLGDCIASP